MKKITLAFMLALAASGTLEAQYRVVYDKKTTQQVISNTGVAEGNEILYTAQIDSTRKNRQKLLSKVTVRNVMKSADMLSRQSLGNLKREGTAYKAVCVEVGKLMRAINRMIDNARKHPENIAFCYRKGAEVVAEATGLVEQMVVIAMNGKVPNPFNTSIEDLLQGKITDTAAFDKNDGTNLILADERIRICNNTFLGIRRLRRAVDIIAFKLNCNYTWRDLIKSSSLKYDYYWAMGMQTGLNQVKYSIDNPPWK